MVHTRSQHTARSAYWRVWESESLYIFMWINSIGEILQTIMPRGWVIACTHNQRVRASSLLFCCLFIVIIIYTARGEEFADLCNAPANGDWRIIFDWLDRRRAIFVRPGSRHALLWCVIIETCMWVSVCVDGILLERERQRFCST
jgi:hypothetical protein